MRYTWALSLWALVLECLLVSPDASARSLAQIKKQGTLTWGGDLQGGEPYVFENPKNRKQLIGFEVEIADELGKRLGVVAKFSQHDWSTLVPSLERGDFDVILNGLEDTSDRRSRIALSAPYFVYGLTITIRNGDSYRSLEALKGHKVGTMNQTVAHSLLKVMPLEAVLYEGQQEPYADLSSGRTDAVLLDHIIAQRYGCNVKGLTCLSDDVTRGYYVMGVRKSDDTLLVALNEALKSMQSDGSLRAILERWRLWDPRQSPLSAAADASADASTDASADASADAPALAAPPEVPRFDAEQIKMFLKGAGITLALSVLAFAIASPFGMALALTRLYGGKIEKFLAGSYIEIFRGTPVLLQLYVLYYGLAPIIKLDAFVAAVLGLGLNYAAYEAEVHRGALLSIPSGQSEAAAALGLSRWQTIRHVLMPQALRTALPAVTNDFVALLKDSSLVSVITVVELTKRMTIAAVEVRSWLIPGLACAVLYFCLSYPLAAFARYLERRLEHDPARSSGKGL